MIKITPEIFGSDFFCINSGQNDRSEEYIQVVWHNSGIV